MPSQYEGIRIPAVGEPLAKTVHSVNWIKGLVRAATNRGGLTTNDGPQERGIRLETPRGESGNLAVPDGSVIGAIGAVFSGLASEEHYPMMLATVRRCQLMYYTKEATGPEVSYITGYPFLPGVPVRVRVKPAGSGYQRKFITGMPVGRADGDMSISAGEGGLILVTSPYTSDGTNYYAYVMSDTVGQWDGFVVKPVSTDGTACTNVLNGRGTYIFGLLAAEQAAASSTWDFITAFRGDFHPRDPAETYVDGVAVRVHYKWGEWKAIWSSCLTVPGLQGKPKEPT